jgi:hypothetical protein
MREHGGWTNWRMEIVHFFTCNNQCEARIKEQEYFVLLNATLNSVEPMPAVKTVPSVIEIPKVDHSSSKFWCEKCDYHTNKPSEHAKHLATKKHKQISNSSNILVNDINTSQKNTKSFTCSCGKQYAYDSGYYRHKKKCNYVAHIESYNIIPTCDKNLVTLLMKENSELKKIIHTQNNIIDNNHNYMMDLLKSDPYNSTSRFNHF